MVGVFLKRFFAVRCRGASGFRRGRIWRAVFASSARHVVLTDGTETAELNGVDAVARAKGTGKREDRSEPVENKSGNKEECRLKC